MKQFKTLPGLYLEAFNKGVFTNKSVCYSSEFKPHYLRLDSIRKEKKRISKLNKLVFEKLKIGDTVTVPFGGNNKADKADKINLWVYSAFSDSHSKTDFDFIIECVVVSKKTKDSNLTLKVIHCDFDGHRALLRNKEIKNNEVFDYNMSYHKLLYSIK
ncbi:hypothetical protein D0C36_02935 [Mucilaginibacter conchicola]|uniref:Uncharacterized protein n=1 Tax=Mucilaginibacter conchicola TaxID=2303333 RepID=A0A372NYC9_9SPHI|nr:hypothetical protein [Mucilaginibacter conchicola]RFZ94517.1 hypothetical protein D0C36_02935 [Mucilaginibacter conchicola]